MLVYQITRWHLFCRRQRLAQKLMNVLEDITDKVHQAYFVDLFVRVSNTTAIQMYKTVSSHGQFQHDTSMPSTL